MAGRKLTAEELAGAEDLGAVPAPASAAPPAGPRKLTAADLEGATEIQPEESRSFLQRAGDSIKSGARAVAHVGRDVGAHVVQGLKHPIDSLLHPVDFAASSPIADPAKRREFERGVDSMVTLGYGQRLAARVGNALGDVERGTSLNETRRFSADPTAGSTGGASQAEAADAAAAPDYRTAGAVTGSFLPGAAGVAGKVGGKILAPIARAAAPLGRSFVAKAASVPVLGALAGPAAAGAFGAIKGVAGYEAAAPLTAALSADAEGHRHEAAHDAAADPAGLLLSGAFHGVPAWAAEPGVLARTANKIEGSRGAEARRFIEERGGGKVGVATPGSGGVFDKELAGVPSDDRGIGIAAKRGAKAIADTIEEQFERDNGFAYRDGPKQIKAAKDQYRDAAADARATLRDVSTTHRRELTDAKRSVLAEAAIRAKAITEQIEHEHAVETSRPYRAIKERIDNSPAAAKPRDVSAIVATMQDAVHDLETAPFVRSQLQEQLGILEHYRDPKTEAVVLPERQLNGLRRTLMRAAKIGMSDAPGEAEAPLRRAAFVAKQMVDEGPYRPLNELYAEGAAKREAAREAVGLKRKPPRDRAADDKRLASILRRSVDDPSAIPGSPSPLADMSEARARIAAPTSAREEAVNRVASDLAAAAAARDASVARVGAASTAAEADRAMLGLNSRIGTRKTDVNQIRLALERQGSNTKTGGGNPADLEAFRKAHPEASTNIDLPELARARADLGFRLVPGHGGLAAQIAGSALGPAAAIVAAAAGHGVKGLLAAPAIVALQNATPIAGRLGVPAARAYRAAILRLAKAARASTSATEFVHDAVKAGLPAQDAFRIYQAAHPVADQEASP